ncbi:RhoGAP domain-containing protein [Cordyceps fumosorosea ARSEF 2679]|uniref:RhoGAP domain-containing protein n=1 Tax=Cordyceps fumosorosea (strain ARSEF 2679) TaxID=1081104 RepID=A0A168DZ33_CORFA|nr:RhoGAP domain-containing protein [Cordyceps fumosorosea ARSEF 2679]OAA73173.1 RhoGAP domain-containing protein [Cordyceps fumosorosea ARSEF 2679]
MPESASTRRRPAAAAAAAAAPAHAAVATTAPPHIDANADPKPPAHRYQYPSFHYASSPPASPRRQPPPPPTSRRLEALHHDLATAQSHDSRSDHTLPQNPQSQSSFNLHDLHAAASHSPQTVNIKPSLSVPSILGPGPRSPRPSAPSPLSANQHYDSRASTNTRAHLDGTTPPRPGRPNRPAARTTFYSDSSGPSSPEQEIAGPRFPNASHDNRSVSEPLSFKKPVMAPGPSNPATDGTAAGASTAPTNPLPRNSSVDTAISAFLNRDPTGNSASSKPPQSSDIDRLIQAAGSPEAVIKYLLKEKQSQSQQNSQIWTLLDKQKTMIIGLNKDLEAALESKERYRKKLRECMNNLSILQAAAARASEDGIKKPRPSPRIDVDGYRGMNPDSPVLDSDSQKGSPVDLTMARYPISHTITHPITPPADRPHQSPSSGVADVFESSHSMSRGHDSSSRDHDAEDKAEEQPRKKRSEETQEHTLRNRDYETEDKTEEQAGRKLSEEEALREIPFGASLPPSRSLPSEPPNGPPPRIPGGSESPPPKSEVSSKPTTTPRRGPPAPLTLPKDRQKSSPLAVEEVYNSESECHDAIGVEPLGSAERGRRRTREKVRDLAVDQTAGKQETTMKDETLAPNAEEPNPTQAALTIKGPEAATASLAAVINSDGAQVLFPPMMSPGLPLSPRPTQTRGQSPPLSPRTRMPLSPRPPRQPIPLPPNTALVASPPPPSIVPSQLAQDSPLNAPKNQTLVPDSPSPLDGQPSPTERKQIFKGLATDEYPDLLLPPNALLSIDVKVASSRMKPSRASLLSLTQLEEDPVFTLAVISRADGGELWRVEKDTASLSKLDQRMKQCRSFKAKTPEKSLFNGHSPAKLDARRRALEAYMDELLNTQLDEATALELCTYLSTNALPPNAEEIGIGGKLSPDQSAHEVESDGPTVRSGYLTKKGKNFGGWKSRFFVVDGLNLKYYETPGGPHLGTIKLQGAQIGKQSHSGDNRSPVISNMGEEFDNHYRHAFLILEPKRKDSSSHVRHILCAEDDKERDDWVEALLKLIESQDFDDVDSHPSKPEAQERQHQGPSGPVKVRKSAHARATTRQAGEPDSLIGVRYDSTNAGDAPQHGDVAPPRSDMQNLRADALAVSAHRLTSAPEDQHLISYVSMASKSGTGPPLAPIEDKKQWKRSFFGIGSKTKSSSDGRGSLAGPATKTKSSSDGRESLTGSDGGAAWQDAPSQTLTKTPTVFGSTLAEAVEFHRPKDVDVLLPSVVYRCIQYLKAHGAFNEAGIFRIPGSNTVINDLNKRFNDELDVDLITDPNFYDIHAVASLLKRYLQNLQGGILVDLRPEFEETAAISNRDERIAQIAHIVQRLPEANLTVLQYLVSFLVRIINNSRVTMMTPKALVLASPAFQIPPGAFMLFLENFEGVFGISPDNYQPPTASGMERGSASTVDVVGKHVIAS